jgi:protein TonB
MTPKKSERVNLEKMRAIFLGIGLIVSLLLILTAFNWRSYDRQIAWIQPGHIEDIAIELPPVTIQKPPEPPPVKVIKAYVNINVVDVESPLDDEVFINADIGPMEPVPSYIPVPPMKEETEPSEVEIFKVVESMPEFPGGEKAMYAFLSGNMIYPETAKDAGISGKVYITFVVERDGSITDVKVMRGIGGGCDEEAVRVIQKMPKWSPGKQRNIPVRVQFILDIKFTLSQL